MDAHDHRLLGPRLDLFHQQEDAPGTVFWHPRGAVLYRTIESYIRARMQCAGFNEVRTPQLMSRSLWERSGHWAKYSDHMFAFVDGERAFALKPMNCPGHVQLFGSRCAHIATCRCASVNSACAIATSLPERCTA
jgi:threonyl-tRNA synthetase